MCIQDEVLPWRRNLALKRDLLPSRAVPLVMNLLELTRCLLGLSAFALKFYTWYCDGCHLPTRLLPGLEPQYGPSGRTFRASGLSCCSKEGVWRVWRC